jgi:hypothetical protein
MTASNRSTEGVNAACDAVAALLNSGKARIYSGTRPANANTALSGNTLLAELTFGSTAFGAAVAGVATANAITADSSADATGTATFARLLKSNGTSVVMDVDVTTSAGSDRIVLDTVAIAAGANVSISSFTITQPA